MELNDIMYFVPRVWLQPDAARTSAARTKSAIIIFLIDFTCLKFYYARVIKSINAKEISPNFQSTECELYSKPTMKNYLPSLSFSNIMNTFAVATASSSAL